MLECVVSLLVNLRAGVQRELRRLYTDSSQQQLTRMLEVASSHLLASGGRVKGAVHLLVFLLLPFATVQAAPETKLSECVSPIAVLDSVDGQVRVQVADSPFPKVPTQLPRNLCAGDQVHVSDNSRARIHHQDQRAIVAAGSVVVLRSAQAMEVQKGAVLLDAPTPHQAYQMMTPRAIVSIDRAHLLVRAESNREDVTVLQGQAAVQPREGLLAYYLWTPKAGDGMTPPDGAKVTHQRSVPQPKVVAQATVAAPPNTDEPQATTEDSKAIDTEGGAASDSSESGEAQSPKSINMFRSRMMQSFADFKAQIQTRYIDDRRQVQVTAGHQLVLGGELPQLEAVESVLDPGLKRLADSLSQWLTSEASS